MKTHLLRYLVLTWLLSHLLHPFIFGIYCSMIESNQLFFGWDSLRSLFSFTCLGIIISFPALLLSGIFLPLILRGSWRPGVAMLLWSITVLLAVNIAVFFMVVMFMGYFHPEYIGIFIPGMIAAVMAIIIRSKQFVKLVYTARFNRLSVQLYHGRRIVKTEIF